MKEFLLDVSQSLDFGSQLFFDDGEYTTFNQVLRLMFFEAAQLKTQWLLLLLQWSFTSEQFGFSLLDSLTVLIHELLSFFEMFFIQFDRAEVRCELGLIFLHSCDGFLEILFTLVHWLLKHLKLLWIGGYTILCLSSRSLRYSSKCLCCSFSSVLSTVSAFALCSRAAVSYLISDSC